MPGGRLLLLALALTVAMATSDLPYCSRSFSPEEWSKEGEAYLLNIREFEQHLQPQPLFLYKLTDMATGKPQSFIELVRTAVAKVIPLNGFYFLICTLVLLLILAFYFIQKKDQFNQISLLNKLLTDKAQTSRHLTFGIVVLLAATAVLCLKGISEVNSQEKAINHIICRTVSTKTIFERNNTEITSQQLQGYVYNQLLKIHGDNFLEFNALKAKLKVAQYPRKNIETIIRSLQEQQYKGSLLKQLQDANKTLQFAFNFLIKQSNLFEHICQRKATTLWYEILSKNEIVEMFLDAVRKERIIDVPIKELPSNATELGKIFFVAILLISVAVSALLLVQQDQSKWLHSLGWLNFIFSVLFVLCFAIVIVTTLFFIFTLWSQQGKKNLLENPGTCYTVLRVLPYFYGELCRAISPVFYETKYFPSSPFYSQVCHSFYNEYSQMTEPYLSKNQTYFYDLMASSAQEIRNNTIKSEILQKIENKYSKIPIIPIMKDLKAQLILPIKLENEILSENINIKKDLIQDLMNTVKIHAVNRAYAIRQICKMLSIVSILILLLSNLAKWLACSASILNMKVNHELQISSVQKKIEDL